MKYRTMQRIALMVISTILPLFLFTNCGSNPGFGDQGVYFQVDNRTDQSLVIFIDNLRRASVQPREVIKFGTLAILPKNIYPIDKKFLVEAKTENEEVVYSKNFSWQELHDMNWEIVIPPLENGSASSDNITMDNVTAK